MHRVREESERLGHARGVLEGLAGTGGVITSAGVVLAATFAGRNDRTHSGSSCSVPATASVMSVCVAAAIPATP